MFIDTIQLIYLLIGCQANRYLSNVLLYVLSAKVSLNRKTDESSVTFGWLELNCSGTTALTLKILDSIGLKPPNF